MDLMVLKNVIKFGIVASTQHDQVEYTGGLINIQVMEKLHGQINHIKQ